MRFFKPAALFLLAFMAVTGLSEGLLRLTRVHYPASLFASDPDLGYVLRPNAEGWCEEESEAYVKINSDGMRDREHTVARAPDVVRVAVVGDSATEAVQLPLDKTYVPLTETELKRVARRKVEVLNFAALGYNLPQELIILRKKVWKYDPQVVVLALSMNGAILKSVRELYTGFGDTQNAPFFVEENGSLTLDAQSRAFQANFHPSTRRDRVMDYVNRSELLSLVNAARVQSGFRWNTLLTRVEPLQAHATPTSALPANYMREWPYLGAANEPLRHAWDLSLKTILAIRDEVARHHAEFWIVTLDMPMQTFPDPSARLAYQHKLGVESLYIPDKLIEKFAVENGIRHIILAPVMTQYVDQTHQVIHLDREGEFASGHMNEIGHRVVASRLASALHAGSEHLN